MDDGVIPFSFANFHPYLHFLFPVEINEDVPQKRFPGHGKEKVVVVVVYKLGMRAQLLEKPFHRREIMVKQDKFYALSVALIGSHFLNIYGFSGGRMMLPVTR